MANAGKVAITPKGEFVNGTSYERLDTVTFEGNLYIAKKANANVLPTDTECWMKALDMDSKLDVTGDTKDNTVTFTSVDSTEAEAWTDVETLKTGENHSSILNKVSTMFKNIRFLYKMLGTTDISKIGEGTITSALSVLNGTATSENYGRVKVTDSSAVTDSTGLALAATEKNASIDGTLAKQIDELNGNLSKYYNLHNITTELTENTDLNDITEAGTYRCSSTAVSSTLKNCPVTVTFKLIVDKLVSDKFTQRIVCIAGSTKMYHRVKTGDTYSDWVVTNCTAINNLTSSSYVEGEALSAYQGKVLNDKLVKYAISDIGSMIFVGDSMMAGVGATLNTGLGYQLANAFGKTVGTDAFIMAQSGCGFVTESSSYPSFETIMKNNASAVSDKNKVTAIVIIGGTNDVLRVKSYADLKTSFQSLCNYIKNTYKNARIYFAPNIMCDGTDTISDYLKGYLNVFGNDFLLNKITYIGNLGSYMRKMYLIGKQEGNTYFNDTVHPNANGYKLMAHFVKSLIIDGGNDISVSIYNTISNYDGCIEIIGERINLRAFSIAIYDSTKFDFIDASAGISLNGIYIGKTKFKLPLGSTSVSTAPYISKQNYGYINVNNTFYPCMFNCMLNKDGTISVFCVCIANSTFVTATSITAIWVALEVEGNINYTNIII